MKHFIVTTPFDGAKFATRYNLAIDAFSMNGNVLTYPDSLPDVPIIDPPDPFVPVPPGTHAHHWPSLGGWIDGQKVAMPELSLDHHECYYIVADNQTALDTFTALPQAQIRQGQLAFLTDHNHLMYWNGTKWVQGW